MVLLVEEDFADGFGDGEFVELVGLLDAAAIVRDGVVSFSRSKRSMSSAFSEVLTGFGVTEGMPPR